MPKGPKGEKRPADVVGNAVHAMRIATGEEAEDAAPASPTCKPWKARSAPTWTSPSS